MINPAIRIPLPFYGRLLIETKNTWYGKPVFHQPHPWKWWKLFVFKPVNTTDKAMRQPGCHSFNCWLYTRKDAICVHVLIYHKSIPTMPAELIKEPRD